MSDEISSPSPREAAMEPEERDREDQQDTDRGGHRLVLPEDGYEWRKYGQKFIKNIDKFRSYFKCHNQNCKAKKKVEWSQSEPGNLRVVYEGGHTHASPTQESAVSSQGTSNANQYNLLNQVLGQSSSSTEIVNPERS